MAKVHPLGCIFNFYCTISAYEEYILYTFFCLFACGKQRAGDIKATTTGEIYYAFSL